MKQTPTKATCGLSVDPWSEYRICGFSEGDPSLVIWDTRNFDKPIVTLSTPHQVSTQYMYTIGTITDPRQTNTRQNEP